MKTIMAIRTFRFLTFLRILMPYRLIRIERRVTSVMTP